MKTIRETLDQLDEITRRGFLKGIGAAAATSAAGNALAQSPEELEKMRRDNMQRMMKMSSASKQQPSNYHMYDNSYGSKVRRSIYPNLVYNGDLSQIKDSAEFELKIAPTGLIVGVKLVKSSGVPEWDNAVYNAIKKTEFIPKDTDGHVPTPIIMSWKP